MSTDSPVTINRQGLTYGTQELNEEQQDAVEAIFAVYAAKIPRAKSFGTYTAFADWIKDTFPTSIMRDTAVSILYAL